MKELTENNTKNFTLDDLVGLTVTDGGTCYKLTDCRDYADDEDWTFDVITGLDDDDKDITEKRVIERPTAGFRLVPVYSYTYDEEKGWYVDEGGEGTADSEDEEVDFSEEVEGERVDEERTLEVAEKEADELRYAGEVESVSDLVGYETSDAIADCYGIK